MLGDVGDLVGEHAGDLVLAVRGQHQPGVHADVAAEGGEGVDLAVAQQEEDEALLRAVAGAGQAQADVGAGSVQQVVQFADRAHQRRQAGDVRQPGLLRARRRAAQGEGERGGPAAAESGSGHAGRMLCCGALGVNAG